MIAGSGPWLCDGHGPMSETPRILGRMHLRHVQAQCPAYLISTEELLNSRAKTVDDMLLIATLCSFV